MPRREDTEYLAAMNFEGLYWVLGYLAFVAYAPVVYSSAKAAAGGRWRNATFARAVGKDLLRTFPMTALVWIPAVAAPGAAKWYALAIHAVFAPLFILEIAHIRQFGSRVGINTFYSLFATNMQEFKEYCRQTVTFWNWVVVAAIYIVPLALIPLIPRAPALPATTRAIACALLFAAFLPFPRNLTKKAARFKIGYILNPYSSFAFHYFQFKKSYAMLAKEIAAHSAPPFAAISSSLPAETAQTYVICIGESANSMHHSYCGYKRATNEFTDALGDSILRIRGVRSPFAQTLPVLEKVLTFATRKKPEKLRTRGSIIDYFKEAGFKTFWISNQYALDDNTPLTALASHADVCKCICYSDLKRFERSVDGSLLPELEKALRDTAAKKVVFLHMIGSHSAYVNRYPSEFVHFQGAAPGKEALNAMQTQMVNAYDDSIRYTDWVITQFTSILAKHSGISYLLYFSDHGEDIYDTPGNKVLGHSQLANIPMTSVPFMLWTSKEYDKARPDIRKRHPKDAYNLEDAINTIIDLSSLSNADFDKSKSIFEEEPA